MHVHASASLAAMRTTIELRDELRAALLELAAKRGEKGFSRLVGEAIEAYLRTEEARDASRQKALSVRGVLSDSDASELRRSTGQIRRHWR